MNTGLNKDCCGGCGETDGNKRCIGCLHPFTTASAPEVIKIVPGDDIWLSIHMAPHHLNYLTGDDRKAVLAYGRTVYQAARKHDGLDATQPKPVFVREGDLDLEKLNKDLIDYRDQIARLRARIAVLDPVFSDAEGYQL